MKLEIETENLKITTFKPEMAESVSRGSLDENNKRFMPDEVFETVEIASEVISDLIDCYDSEDGPFVFPILLKNEEHIGHVEAVKIDEGWEIGYHISKEHCKKGYATEAVQKFIPIIMNNLEIKEIFGICDAENLGSRAVLEKNGFNKIYDGMGPYHGKQCHICKYVYKAY
ncbi:MAG: GNAT family N-acetyltransferase [Tissierellia bacterium]|nr:GNAT family N-acetyltransferase [Tissierellia bacterium]